MNRETQDEYCFDDGMMGLAHIDSVIIEKDLKSATIDLKDKYGKEYQKKISFIDIEKITNILYKSYHENLTKEIKFNVNDTLSIRNKDAVTWLKIKGFNKEEEFIIEDGTDDNILKQAYLEMIPAGKLLPSD